MQIVATWNKQASVVKSTDIIITNCALIKQKKAKITCLCDFCFLLFFCLQLGADWEAISKARALCFTGLSKHSKTIKVFSCLETSLKHSHSFLKYYFESTISNIYQICIDSRLVNAFLKSLNSEVGTRPGSQFHWLAAWWEKNEGHK